MVRRGGGGLDWGWGDGLGGAGGLWAGSGGVQGLEVWGWMGLGMAGAEGLLGASGTSTDGGLMEEEEVVHEVGGGDEGGLVVGMEGIVR